MIGGAGGVVGDFFRSDIHLVDCGMETVSEEFNNIGKMDAGMNVWK